VLPDDSQGTQMIPQREQVLLKQGKSLVFGKEVRESTSEQTEEIQRRFRYRISEVAFRIVPPVISKL